MYNFSVIIYFSNDERYLKEAIESVINQTIDFNLIQLILVDNGSTDVTSSIAFNYQDKYSNVEVYSKNDFNLNLINGEYVNFFSPNAKFDRDVFSKVSKHFDKSSIIALSDKNRTVDIFRDYENHLVDCHSCFFKREILNSSHINFFELNRLLFENNELILVDASYEFLNEAEIGEDFFNLDYHLKLIEYSKNKSGNVADFIKYNIACDLTKYYNVSSSDILSKKEFIEFHDSLNRVLSHIDEEFITSNEHVTPYVESFLMFLKNREFHVEVESDNVVLKSGDYVINSLKDMHIIVDIIEVIDNTLNISLCFRSCCDYDYLSLNAFKLKEDGTSEQFDAKFFDYPTTNRYPIESIGYFWKFDYSCDLKIPLREHEKSRIYFKLIYEENGKSVCIQNPLQFQNYDAGLSKVSNYMIKDNHMVIYNGESFLVQDYSFAKSLKLEIISILKMIKDHNSSTLPAIFYHLLFLFAYPFMKNKRIWLFQDRVDVADDNAKHLFEYAIGQDDNIKKYYVISGECEDFKMMKRISDDIIRLGSFKNKFYYMFCEKIISSHVNHSWLNPFFNPKRPYYNGLLTVEKCFLQHGVIKDDLSSWLRKYFQNLHLFLTSSDYERDSIFSRNYNYEENVVHVFGLPRHDNLKFGVSKKEILFAPTWRKNLTNRIVFEKSDYFKRLNSFLNNEKLLSNLKSNGYKLVFKPHYDLLPFMDLFNIPDDVEVNVTDSYQTLFNDSALLITDYSSVFFDFAFLKKPVIYYHEGNDYHYIEGYFKYNTMGFGPVVECEDDLVDKIIQYIANGCVMEDEYKERVSDFFKYHDQRNCSRVYDWLYEN